MSAPATRPCSPGVPLGIYECPAPYHRLLTPEMLAFCAGSGRFLFIKDTSCVDVDRPCMHACCLGVASVLPRCCRGVAASVLPLRSSLGLITSSRPLCRPLSLCLSVSFSPSPSISLSPPASLSLPGLSLSLSPRPAFPRNLESHSAFSVFFHRPFFALILRAGGRGLLAA